MDEQPVVEQENDVNDLNGASGRLKDLALSTSGAEPGEFDPEQFASLMQKELIAYNFSWDPLLKALQALGKSMARQQKVQKSNNESVEEIHDQVGSLRDQLSQVQSEKDTMGTTLATLKDQMEAIQAQMEKLQQDHQGRDSNAADQSNNEPGTDSSKGDGDDNPASSDSQNPFVTTKDLAKAKKDLSKHLRRSLTEAFGDEVNDDDTGGDDEDVHEGDNGAGKADGNSPTAEEGETKKAQTSFKRPGAPFASDAIVKQEIARLEQLQDALNDKLAAHDLQLESLLGKIGDLDAKSDEFASHLETNGDGGNKLQTLRQATSFDGDGDVGSSSGGLISDALLKELSELKAAQDSHAQLLKDQHQAVGKNASDIKALVASLDDLAVQQQTAASLFGSGANQASSASDGAADSRASTRRTSDGGNSQLDLSLVFTKITDLRRSTDASLDSLQKNINEVSNATNAQQAQLDALRNGLVFNEHQRLHMIESRLAMQKELLDRNQTHQDRTKPQLAEWRKALELNDEKLTQGLCDEEILQELQQLQRHYRRTYLSFSPLINSPLTIAESLQVLTEEVKQFQNGVKAGVVPLHGSNESTSNSSGGPKKNEREEEFTKKLRYLDEEVDATLQVNIVTEKKNDPLIKSLDAMREKLESLSSMWYRNYTQRKRASRGQSGGSVQGSITDSDCTPRSASGDYDGLREVELRLMGAVRRLGMVEEDVERLNSLSAINASEMSSATRAAAIAAATNGDNNARMKSESDDLGKLRKEVYAEIAKLTAHLGNLQLSPSHHQGNSTVLVPLSGSASSQLAGSRSASHVSQNDLVNELYSQMKGRELDGRFQEIRDDEVQKQLYDNFLKEVTKKVTHAVLNVEKNGGGVGGRVNGVNAAGAGAAGNNGNYRLMLENFTQKVEDRLEDAREMTAEELLRMKKELADQLKIKIDLALRELRSELMFFPADTGDSTAMGTKPVMCVACSRPVPVSGLIREAGSLPPAELQAEAHSPPHNHSLQPDYLDYERADDEFVYRAGFRMPANDSADHGSRLVSPCLCFCFADEQEDHDTTVPVGQHAQQDDVEQARGQAETPRAPEPQHQPRRHGHPRGDGARPILASAGPRAANVVADATARREKAKEEEGEGGGEEEEEAVADLHGMREQDLDRTDYSVTSSTTPSKSSSVSGRAGCGAIAEEFGGLQEDPELDFEEECADSDILDDPDGEMTIMNDDDDELADDDEEEVMEHSISFQVSRATVTRSGLLPCCVFVGRVTWGTADWEIYFGQKQLLRLHINLYIHQLMYRHKLMRDVSLPWTIWREKRAERRVADVHIVQHYIRTLLKDRDLRNSEPLLAFLEVSPSRAMSRYGPSLKEGYVHMRMNGPFQLPLYTCFNRTIESLYRHLYRTWMRIAYVSAVVGVMAPLFLIIITNLGTFFSPQKQLISDDGDSVSTKLDVTGVFIGLFSLAGIIFCVAFVYKFFDHRLGVIRRWVVLKPSCFAAYRNRSDREPSEVFLFDKSFAATKGSYRQGVSWMPSGLVVGSKAGFIEIDTGHYYTRLTAFVSLALVCWGIMQMSRLAYDFEEVNIPVTNGVSISSVAEMSNWTTTTLEEERYCGYFFEVPEGKSIYARPIDSEAIVSQLRLPTNNTFTSNVNYFWQSSEVAYNLGVITNSIGSGRIVGVAKKVNPATDVFLPSNYAFEIPDVGNITITGLQGTNLLQYHAISHFCEIPIKVAPVNWSTLWRYLLLLFVGGIVAPSSGLLVNYIITYLGLWHAHVRRDHWYRCVRRLQKLKRQETEYRYHSFAPERVSSLGEAFQKNHMTSFAKLGVIPAAASGSKSRQNSDSDSSDIDSKGSTQSGGSYSAVPGPPSAVAWHVDGEDTYEAMYKAISNAKYEILIAGWWVCPDVFLLRPGRKLPERGGDDAKKTNETQLRNLLLLKAQAGVKIYVLIYREVKLALTLNSSYSKRSLLVHPNIRVLRDPIFQIQSLGFWSHHEKIVCVDQSLAFVGGLDLCFGRYDHSGHPLSDPGGDKLQDQTWPGKDYSNPIIKDFVRVNQPFEDLIDRPSQPRMPWHDVHCSVSGPPVQDIAYHFIQRWNFVCSKNDYQLRTGWCICLRSRRFKFLPKCLVPMDFNGWKLRYPSSDTSLQTVPATAIPLAHNDSCDIEPFDVMAPNTMPTNFSPGFMAPWGNGSGGTTSFGSDIPMQAGPPLSETLGETEILRAQRGESILQVFHPNAKVCNVQVCRSVSMWSAGVPTEASIQEAYIDIITKSKHFIYIENQFFISGVNSNGVVSNRILQALVDRIERAVKANEVFRVYVVMPLLPAFEGNIRSEELTNLHAVMHWQFATISRGKYSLFAALESVTNKPENYVSFFGLRKYGILPNGCVSTEQIYIHSKLLIADDMYAILGSANINDRSMMGDRDSEIAVIIEDMQFQDGVMNEKSHRRGVVVSALRLQLFREHLGLADSDDTVLDPTSEHTWLQIRGVGQQNTKIYETVFDCAPSNKMRAFTSFQNIEISQIYENQRLNVLKVPGRHHVWDKENLKEGDYSPWTDVNGVPIPPEKFNLEEDYVLDNVKDKKKKHLFSMDNDGWCYARNFSIFQEVRTGKTDFKKREKLQHFMTDRLMAQVRRRRWVKKGTMALAAMSRYSSVSESDDEEHNRFISLWRRFQNGEFSRANSLTLPPRDHSRRPSISSSAVMSGDASYPNSPMMSSFRRTPLSPMSTVGSRRNSLVHGRNGINTRASTFGGTNNSVIGNSHESDARLQDQHHEDRGSVESVGKGLGQSLRKWYSAVDLDFGRRSKFNAEYFDQDSLTHTPHIIGDEPLLESGRGSLRSIKSGRDEEDERVSNELGECQIGHVQTAATVPKEGETRARLQLSEIRGHLVEFPLDFLVEEILKPSIMPSDIHI